MRNSTLVVGVLAALLSGCDPAGTTSEDGGTDGGACTGRYPVVHVGSNVTVATVWKACTVYAVDSSFVISATLTIEPGAIVKLAKGPAITFDEGGAMVAVGEPTSPVVFTSIKDDSHGGDSNDDGAATTPAPGDWNSIKLSGTGSRIGQCHVMYGGDYGYWPRNRGDHHWHEDMPGVVHKTLRTGFGSPTGLCWYEGKMLHGAFSSQLSAISKTVSCMADSEG